MGGLDKGALGRISVPGRRAIVFQDARLLPWKRVWRNVTIGLEGTGSALRGRALAALSEGGLAERVEAWVAEAVTAGAPGEAGWGPAIDEIKHLPRQGKAIGPVPRKDAAAGCRAVS